MSAAETIAPADLILHVTAAKRATPSCRFWTRPETSDVKAVAEVFAKNAYRRPSVGFTIDAGEPWVDLGTNIGSFAVLASALGAPVLRAVEAEATNAEITRMNVALNDAPVDVVHAAVVPDDFPDREVALHVNTAPLALRRHSILKARKDSAPVVVPALRWSDAIAGAAAAKVNIEGAEIPILLQAIETGAFGDLHKLVFEWSFDVEPAVPVLRQMLDGLERHFGLVKLSKRIDFTLPTFPHYPPNVYVFAMR